MTRLQKAVLGAVVALGLSGCAPDDRSSYVAPKAPQSEMAILKGGYNCTVNEVDGERVDFQFALNGGNKVPVTPGLHKLLVCVKVPGGGPPPGQRSGLNVTFGPHDNDNFFKFICVKGHTYEFSRRGMFNTDLMVTDENTGQKMNIESDGPD